jgi:hypothetical protein
VLPGHKSVICKVIENYRFSFSFPEGEALTWGFFPPIVSVYVF